MKKRIKEVLYSLDMTVVAPSSSAFFVQRYECTELPITIEATVLFQKASKVEGV